MPDQTDANTPEPISNQKNVTIPLLLSTNSQYLQHTAVCLTSLLVNNPDIFFKIVLAVHPTETLDEEKLRRSLNAFSNKVLLIVKFAPPLGQPLPLNPGAHYTREAWNRLWVDNFFCDSIDRVLYLDVDIIVSGSLISLWNTNLQGSLLGVVDIPGAERNIAARMKLLGIRPEEGYFNSGVLLIDLKQWRDTRALDTVLTYVSAHSDKLWDPDQDALNACFHSRKKRLDYKWNAIRPFFREPSDLPLSPAELTIVRKEARIIHFNGSSKPWSYLSDHPRKQEYEKYLRMTEWRDYIPPDRTPTNRLRKGISAVIPRRVKNFLK